MQESSQLEHFVRFKIIEKYNQCMPALKVFLSPSFSSSLSDSIGVVTSKHIPENKCYVHTALKGEEKKKKSGPGRI